MRTWFLVLALTAGVASTARGRVAGADGPATTDWTIAAVEASPGVVGLDMWQSVLLGRYLAVDGMIRKYTRFHKVPFLWTVLPFYSESLMDPLAKGPQDDDRGLGQVGYWAERHGRLLAKNPNSADYNPEFKERSSIWNPQTNIILAAIHFRWVRTDPKVTNSHKAYAVYTFGDAGLTSTGEISPEAQLRVNRAAGFEGLVTSFIRLKKSTRHIKIPDLDSLVSDPRIRALLTVDRHAGDGQRAYNALRRVYTEEVAATDNPWVFVTFAREAINFADLGRRAYRSKEAGHYRRLRYLLTNRESLGTSTGDSGLIRLYRETLAAVEERIG